MLPASEGEPTRLTPFLGPPPSRSPAGAPGSRPRRPAEPGALPRAPHTRRPARRQEHPKLPPKPWKPGRLENTPSSHWCGLEAPRRRPAPLPPPCCYSRRPAPPRIPKLAQIDRSLSHQPRLPPSPSPGPSAEPREQHGKGGRRRDGGGRERSFRPCGCGRPFGETKEGTGPALPLAHLPAAAPSRRFESPQPGQENRPKQNQERLFLKKALA